MSMDQHTHHNEVAIIGMSGRFPGANNVKHFWENLAAGVESINLFTDEQMREAGTSEKLLNDPNFVAVGSNIDNVTNFDANFFGFSPREAELTPPHNRHFLEVAWEALESAGYDPDGYPGDIGVYAGVGMNAYLFYNIFPSRNADVAPSVEKDYVATGTAFKLGLTGPSVNVQSFCSTSLVSIHLACKSLLNNEADMTIAGGASVRIPSKGGHYYRPGDIYSADGHCRAFDEQASGTVFADGVGVVVLKRLDRALQDADNILAVIKGSAMNNDGAVKASFAAPSVFGQVDVIRKALEDASVDPKTISYVEAHGTGTAVGDPIEITALKKAFGDVPQNQYCALGSLKTNIGHADAASGVAGLIKTVLAMQHKQLPATLNYQRANPDIDFESSPFHVNTQLNDWKPIGDTMRAGVSSFGIGGTNAHLIVEQAPPLAASGHSREYQLLLLSARSQPALQKMSENLADHLENQDVSLADTAYTLVHGRKQFPHRRFVVVNTSNETNTDAVSALRFISTQTTNAQHTQGNRPLIFLFTGQGSQAVNMGLDLYRGERVFRDAIETCADILSPHLSCDIRDVIYPKVMSDDKHLDMINNTDNTQPALFCLEYALARLWMSWGIKPAGLTGHSIGEYVAACIAGVFTLENALLLVSIRGQLMGSMKTGSMLAVHLSQDKILNHLDGSLALAAVNAPQLCVVSGETENIIRFQEKLQSKEIVCTPVTTSHAFHSAMMDPILDAFFNAVQQATPQRPTIPFISNLTGTWITNEQASSVQYWVDHLRSTVLFDQGMQVLLENPDHIFLELGPGKSLTSLVARHINRQPTQLVLSSLPHPRDKRSANAHILDTIGQLWQAGISIDWNAFYQGQKRHRVPLPTYPFERQKYWVEAPKAGSQPSHQPFDDSKLEQVSDWFRITSWKRSPLTVLKKQTTQESTHYLIFMDNEGIADQQANSLREAGHLVTCVSAGESFAELETNHFSVSPNQTQDYSNLLSHLSKSIPDVVIHCWNLYRPNEQLSEYSRMPSSQDRAFYSLLFLVQAISTQAMEHKIRILVLSNNVHEIGGESYLCPEKATLLGPVNVTPQELPNINVRAIDIELPENDTAKQRLAQQLSLEIVVPAERVDSFSEKVVSYRGNYRWVQDFQPLLSTAVTDKTSESQTAFRKKGTYLITGGLGGVGLVVAQHLATHYQAKLILIGRSQFPDREMWEQWLEIQQSHNSDKKSDPVSNKITILLEMEKAGADILLCQADVSNLSEMQQVVEQAEQRFGCVHGVIHTAGTAGGGMIQLKTPEMVENVMRPKLQGTLILDQLFKNKKLDIMVLSSSLSAVPGEFGQVDYSGANAFNDAFSLYRNRRGQHTTCINWDVWQEVGMSVHAAEKDGGENLREQSLNLGMTSAEGIDALEQIVCSSQPRVIISTYLFEPRMEDVFRFAFEAESLSEINLNDGELHPRPELVTPFVMPTNDTERVICNIWQEMLRIDKVGIDDSFFDVGGDSLLGIQVMAKVNKACETNLNIITLYESATPASLALKIVPQQEDVSTLEDNDIRGQKRRSAKSQRRRQRAAKQEA